MSFKYKIADADNTPGATAFITGTSTQAEMRGQVYLKTPDMPTDTLFTDQWYLNDINVLPVWNDGSGQFVGWVEAIAETHHNQSPMRWVSRCSTHPTR